MALVTICVTAIATIVQETINLVMGESEGE